jgi:hypothetical protein
MVENFFVDLSESQMIYIPAKSGIHCDEGLENEDRLTDLRIAHLDLPLASIA